MNIETNGAHARTAFLGGAFDPVHRGHVMAALSLRQALRIDTVQLMPYAKSTFYAGRPEAPGEVRIGWLRKVADQYAGLEACDVELQPGAPVESVYTMKNLRKQLGGPPIFGVGSDAFLHIGEWDKPRELLATCSIAVITRGHAQNKNGHSLQELMGEELAQDFQFSTDGREAHHRDREAGTWVRKVRGKTLGISSTQVRKRLQRREPAYYLLPAPVQDEILESGYYREHKEQRKL